MDSRRGDKNVGGSFIPVDVCKDAFRYRLVQVGGRYRFDSVRFEGLQGCRAEDLAGIVEMLEDHWLDEIDLQALESIQCGSARCRSCPCEVARMVRDVREIVQPRRQPQRAESSRGP